MSLHAAWQTVQLSCGAWEMTARSRWNSSQLMDDLGTFFPSGQMWPVKTKCHWFHRWFFQMFKNMLDFPNFGAAHFPFVVSSCLRLRVGQRTSSRLDDFYGEDGDAGAPTASGCLAVFQLGSLPTGGTLTWTITDLPWFTNQLGHRLFVINLGWTKEKVVRIGLPCTHQEWTEMIEKVGAIVTGMSQGIKSLVICDSLRTWTWPSIVDLPIKSGDVRWFTYQKWWCSLIYLSKMVIYVDLPLKNGDFLVTSWK